MNLIKKIKEIFNYEELMDDIDTLYIIAGEVDYNNFSSQKTLKPCKSAGTN